MLDDLPGFSWSFWVKEHHRSQNTLALGAQSVCGYRSERCALTAHCSLPTHNSQPPSGSAPSLPSSLFFSSSPWGLTPPPPERGAWLRSTNNSRPNGAKTQINIDTRDSFIFLLESEGGNYEESRLKKKRSHELESRLMFQRRYLYPNHFVIFCPFCCLLFCPFVLSLLLINTF